MILLRSKNVFKNTFKKLVMAIIICMHEFNSIPSVIYVCWAGKTYKMLWNALNLCHSLSAHHIHEDKYPMKCLQNNMAERSWVRLILAVIRPSSCKMKRQHRRQSKHAESFVFFMWMVGFNHVNSPRGLFTQHNEKIIGVTNWNCLESTTKLENQMPQCVLNCKRIASRWTQNS